MPLSVLLRNRLKYALTYKEVKMICMQRLVKVDAKVRTDMNFPTGFMDVVTLEKTNQHFRMLSAPLFFLVKPFSLHFLTMSISNHYASTSTRGA